MKKVIAYLENLVRFGVAAMPPPGPDVMREARAACALAEALAALDAWVAADRAQRAWGYTHELDGGPIVRTPDGFRGQVVAIHITAGVSAYVLIRGVSFHDAIVNAAQAVAE